MKKSLQNTLFILTLCFSIVSAVLSYKAFAATECYPDPGVGCLKEAWNEAKNEGDVSGDAIVKSNMNASIGTVAEVLLAFPNKDGSFALEDIQNSLPGKMAFAVSYMYQKQPANLALWVQDTGQTLGFIPKSAYAQGTGFVGLYPLLNVWKVFRNIAYILIAVALVIIGFMIMFRRQIDPHTVMTIQNSLPRVIIALILITFSYAIAAFMIELMYIVLFIVISLITAGFGGDVKMFTDTYVLGGAGQLMGRIMAPLSKTEGPGALLGTIVPGIAFAGLGAIPAILIAIVGFFVSGLVSFLGGAGGGSGAVAAAISPILWLVFGVALFFFFFRVLFLLLGAYIQILLAVIIAPLQILLDVFPGGNGFMGWLASLVGNLATFVIVAAVLMIDGAILSNINGSQPLWSPPFIGGLDINLLKMIIGVGGVMVIPNIVKSMKEMLKADGGLGVGGGAASAIQQPIGFIGQAVQTAGSFDQLSGGWVRRALGLDKNNQHH